MAVPEPVLLKQPWEERLYDFPLADVLAAGDTIASVDSVAALPQGRVTEVTALTFGVPTHDGASTAQVRIIGGTDNEDYVVRLRVNTANGDKVEADGYLRVRDLPAGA